MPKGFNFRSIVVANERGGNEKNLAAYISVRENVQWPSLFEEMVFFKKFYVLETAQFLSQSRRKNRYRGIRRNGRPDDSDKSEVQGSAHSIRGTSLFPTRSQRRLGELLTRPSSKLEKKKHVALVGQIKATVG